MKPIIAYLTIALMLFSTNVVARPSPPRYVSVELMGQLGNQLFQIAAAYTYALDHNIPLYVPGLFSKSDWNISHNGHYLFQGKLNGQSSFTNYQTWSEPAFTYTPIPSWQRIHLYGYFQSEKYFAHRRNEISDLFSCPPHLMERIQAKYPILQSTNQVVGVQIRDYRREFPSGEFHPTHGRSYYENAFQQFSADATFLISTNNADLARECVEGLSSNLIYLEGTDYIEDFFTLAQCDSFIISNSSFGWWAAWLSKSENKKVLFPNKWFALPYINADIIKDLVPSDWFGVTYD
jgi:hypothetical protein